MQTIELRAWLLTLLLVCPAWTAARDLPGAPALTVQDRLTYARDAIKSRNWSDALFELDQAAREEPGNADVHNLLGYAYRNNAPPNLSKAFEHYKRALLLDPLHRGAHEYIGEAYLIDKKPADAERHLAELARICGTTGCEEYIDLARAIAAYKARGK